MQTLNIEAFNPKKAELIELATSLEHTRSITIVDTKTYDQVHKAQMELRNARIQIEKTGKTMREDANAFIKAVRTVELDMLAVITPLEDELKSKKEAYDNEQERIKQEAEQKKQQAIADRTIALAKYAVPYNTLTHAPQVMNEADFSALISSLEAEYQEKEKARKEQEEADRIAREKFEEDQRKFREEQEKLEAEKRAIEEEKAKIEAEKREAEQAKIDAENEKKRQAELEQAREEARIKAIEDQKRADEQKRLDDERKAREEQEALEKKKKYQAFLESIGLTEENKNEFTFIDCAEWRKYYRYVGIYKR